ncbi:MAG: aminoglycoside phosphotransferase family protein [Raoultibacter sp.]
MTPAAVPNTAARNLATHQVQAYFDGNAALRDALGIAARATCPLRPLARGEYNANFVFTHPATRALLLLRINLGSQMHLPDQIGYEAHALHLLDACPRTPRVLFVAAAPAYCGAGVLVQEYLPGAPLCYETDLVEAAHILADVHAVALPPHPGLVAPKFPQAAIVSECEEMFAVYRQSALARPQTLARIDHLFQAARATIAHEAPQVGGCLINTELNARNFLINPGAPGYLIDWEKPLLGAPEQDLAHFLAPTTTLWKTDTVLGLAPRTHFLEAYCAAAGRPAAATPATLTPYLRITCLRGISWCAMALVDYAARPPQARDAYTYAKIQHFLSEGFLTFIEREYFS